MGAIGRNVAEFSGRKFLRLTFVAFTCLTKFCSPFQVTVLDTTNTESLDWVTYFKGESDGRRGWREASYTNEHGDVVRVYTVCNVATTTVDSWLRTPFIATGDANRLYIDMRFGMRKCTKYPHPGRLQQCKESFKLLYFESDADSADADHPAWDEGSYRHVDVIAADKVFTELNRANVNSETRSVPVTRRGVYFAFFDQGACISLLSIRVYYIVCPSVTLNLAVFANTTTGPHLTSIVQREGSCVDHAVVDQLPSYLCKGDGNWYFLTGGCKCRPGYEPTRKPDATLCGACPLHTFKWQTGNEVCLPCPAHSTASEAGQTECRCDEGYYRSSHDERNLPCTRPPSAVQNVTLVYRDQTSVIVTWDRPSDFGGRHDLEYCVECIGCTEKTIYEPRQAGFNTTRVTLTGLTPDTSYRVIVHSENGVSRLNGVHRQSPAVITANTEAAVPSKITNLRMTSVGTDFVSLAWSCPQSHISIDIYEVKYWKDDDVDDNVSNFTAWQNITLDNMMQRTRYSFQVRGKTNKGWGEYSDVIYGTTGHISHFPAENPIGIVVGFAISIVICMLIVIVFIAIFVRRNSRIDRKKSAGDCDMLNSSGPCSLGLDGTLILDGGLTMPLFAPPGVLQAYVDPHTYEDPSQAVREFTKEIDAACITIEAVIGGGEFGDVCKGRMRLPGNGDLIVAIKTLKSGTSDKNRLDFLTEASIMGQFDHPNVIYLEGVVTRSNPIMIVTEYMENGSLDTFLRNNDGKFSVVQLIGMIRGIASGMSYLADMGYIHRDLAARNILVNENLICKVSDFGLSRELESDASDGVYTTKGGKIPVRWTAPEAIVYRKFTSASDVWSFGVVTWEVMSYGERPYWTWSNQDVIKAVDNGYRLPPPMDCPEAAYELMLDCWQHERSHRPKFTSVVIIIDKLIRAPELLRKIATPRPNDSLWLSCVEDNSSSYESVEEWLKDIKMQRYADNFQKCGLTSMDQVTQITHKDLVRLDISLIGHQKKILNSVQALRANANNAQAGDALLL